MVDVSRRRLIRMTGMTVGASAFAGCSSEDNQDSSGEGGDTAGDGASSGDGGDGSDTETAAADSDKELTELSAIEPEGAITIPKYLYGKDQDAWEQNGINLNLEVAAFGKFSRQLVDGLSDIAGHSIMYAIQYMEKGEEPMTSIGQQLNFYNQILTKADSGINDVQALEDVHLGVPFKDSQTTRVVRAMLLDEYDFDILNDPKEVSSSPPPALWNLLNDGELDATLQFSGFTLAAAARDDMTTVFDPFAYWKDRTGQPPSVADFVVKESWLENNPQVALDYLNSWWDATEIFRENTQEAVQQYGRLGGVSSEAEQEVVKQWANDNIIAPAERGYSQELADSTDELMKLLSKYDLLEGVPDDTDPLYTTTDELKDMI